MNDPAQANPPLCRTEDASEQVEAVARFFSAGMAFPVFR